MQTHRVLALHTEGLKGWDGATVVKARAAEGEGDHAVGGVVYGTIWQLSKDAPTAGAYLLYELFVVRPVVRERRGDACVATNLDIGVDECDSRPWFGEGFRRHPC
jgi:hypothetical protein